jgi:large subunit ribosomal protein L10
MLKEQKEQVVAELVERLQASDTLFVADYRGLDMTAIDEVRTELLKHGARFSVVKNTLTKRAAEQAGVSDLVEFLDGPTAIAFVGDGDMVAVAKALSDSARQTKILALKGGILEGKPMTADEIQRLASLPSADVLRGQVLGAIVAPLNAIVGLVNAPLQNLHGLLDARIEQLREQGDTSDAEAAAPETEEPPAPEAEAEPAAEEVGEPEAADETSETPEDTTQDTKTEEE